MPQLNVDGHLEHGGRFTVSVETSQPPTIVRPAGDGEPGSAPSQEHEKDKTSAGVVRLDWDRAIGDAGQLRRCPVCGCQDLYTQRSVPHLTVFIAVLAAALAVMLVIGGQHVFLALLVLLLLVVLEVMILLMAGKRVVCYRCGSRFSGPAANPSGFEGWQAGVAERWQRPNPKGAGASRSDRGRL